MVGTSAMVSPASRQRATARRNAGIVRTMRDRRAIVRARGLVKGPAAEMRNAPISRPRLIIKAAHGLAGLTIDGAGIGMPPV